MAKVFVEVARVPVCVEKGKKYQVELVGNEVVISKEATVREWENITKSCTLEFRDSHHCTGRYIAIIHKDCGERVVVAVIGMAGIQVQHGFKVGKPIGAFTSFVIHRKI